MYEIDTVSNPVGGFRQILEAGIVAIVSHWPAIAEGPKSKKQTRAILPTTCASDDMVTLFLSIRYQILRLEIERTTDENWIRGWPANTACSLQRAILPIGNKSLAG
ncbi:hypothetical protein ACQZ42_17565 [Rhizobium rhizogenes]